MDLRAHGRSARYITVLLALVAAIYCETIARAEALELVMFRTSWCPYCKKFEREVLPIYNQTSLGERISLQILDISEQDNSMLQLDAPIEALPTFVLLDEGYEVSRFAGYSDPSSFFRELTARAGSF